MAIMLSLSRRRYEARAQIAKALAHPSRLMMLDALQQRDCCVSELTTLVGADQSTISKHLAVLKAAGLVTDRREGAQMFYSLRTRCLGGFWSCIETVLQQNLEAQQEALR